MKVLALEPYYGGSHRAFLDGWLAHSRHEWTLLGLPPFKWKWRMRHAAITFADQAADRARGGESWDALFCSDMLNLAEFKGLAPEPVRGLPAVAYFHENQLTYPVRKEDERDYHFVMNNVMTALAADAVWFNSAFHRDSFLEALPAFLRRMPDCQPWDAADRIRAKAAVHPPGIEPPPPRGPRTPGPVRILWAARWEHDKDPDTFFRALERLDADGVAFRVSVVGEQFRETPEVFDWARERFADHIDRWGYQASRADYDAALVDADVIVSTARHEFFGLSVAEAAAAGCYPLVPRRLAYPEVLGALGDAHFYRGGPKRLAERLADLAERTSAGTLWEGDPGRGARAVEPLFWPRLAPALDDAIEQTKR